MQACLNGARPAGFFPTLPLTARVGLEDGCLMPDGTTAAGNAALVTAALAEFTETRGTI